MRNGTNALIFRGIVKSLMAVSIPVSVVDISSWGGAGYQSHSNVELGQYSLDSIPRLFKFDIFIINAANTAVLLFQNNLSSRITTNGYRIAVWHWEASYIPTIHCEYANYFNEIWAPSSYVAAAISTSSCFPDSVTVRIIPYAYDESAISLGSNGLRMEHIGFNVSPRERDQSRLRIFSSLTGLVTYDDSERFLYSRNVHSWIWDENRTLYLSLFDFNSDFNRKNILELIGVYRDAFYDHLGTQGSNVNVGLILKSINGDKQALDYEAVIDAVSGVPYILFVDGLLPDVDLNELKSSADCFVSLHRSEGWGLNVIEELLSQRPVIVSSYGGTESYLKNIYEEVGVSELRIPIQLVNIDRPFGPYATDMKWAQPDHNAAVFAMRQVFHLRAHYQNTSKIIGERIFHELSPAQTGVKILNRLQEIAFCLCIYIGSTNLNVKKKCGLPPISLKIWRTKTCSSFKLGKRWKF